MTTAKIYQFPTKVRPALGHFDAAGHFDEAKFATAVASPSVVPTVFGSGWYHDEAIMDAERTRKN